MRHTFAILAASISLAASVLAGSLETHEHVSRTSERYEQTVERLVFVTGSLIPQRIQVRRVGTTTLSPLRVIDRQEIDQTGRFTTPGAFVNDPSVRIIGH